LRTRLYLLLVACGLKLAAALLRQSRLFRRQQLAVILTPARKTVAASVTSHEEGVP